MNAYGQIDGQVGCCGGEAASAPASVEPLACCTPAPKGSDACCTPSKPVAEREACCTPAEKVGTIEAGASYCSPNRATSETPELLKRLAELTRRYDINDYAASVKVFAVKA